MKHQYDLFCSTVGDDIPSYETFLAERDRAIALAEFADKNLARKLPNEEYCDDPKKAQAVCAKAVSASRAAALKVKSTQDGIEKCDEERKQLGAEVLAWEQEAGELEAAVLIGDADSKAQQQLVKLREKVAGTENSGRRRQLRATRQALETRLEEAIKAYWKPRRVTLSAQYNVVVLAVTELRAQVAELTAKLSAEEGKLHKIFTEDVALRYGQHDSPPVNKDDLMQCKRAALKEAEDHG